MNQFMEEKNAVFVMNDNEYAKLFSHAELRCLAKQYMQTNISRPDKRLALLRDGMNFLSVLNPTCSCIPLFVIIEHFFGKFIMNTILPDG